MITPPPPHQPVFPLLVSTFVIERQPDYQIIHYLIYNPRACVRACVRDSKKRNTANHSLAAKTVNIQPRSQLPPMNKETAPSLYLPIGRVTACDSSYDTSHTKPWCLRVPRYVRLGTCAVLGYVYLHAPTSGFGFEFADAVIWVL